MISDVLSQAVDTGNSVISLKSQMLIPLEVASLGFFLSRSHKHLHELNLRGCLIGDNGMSIIHQYLCGDKSNEIKINKMFLANNDLTVASSSFICDFITNFEPHELSFRGNSVTRVSDICRTLFNSTTINALDISENSLTSLEAPWISRIVTCLVALFIWGNKLGDDGAVVLTEGIIKSNTLKQLEIGDNNIRARGIIAIAKSLMSTPIAALGISRNEIDRDGAIAIGELIANSKTLQTLSVGGDDALDEESALIVIRSMYDSTTMNVVHLPWSLLDSNNVKGEAENINTGRAAFKIKEVLFRWGELSFSLC